MLTSKHVHLLPAIFFQVHLEKSWGMDMQTRCDISRMVEVKLPLSANEKSYMLHRLAQQRMTLSDLE